MKKRSIYFLVRTGVIAGVYIALTVLLAPISFGAIQCRVSECMALFPLFFVEAIPGLVIGCLVSNLISGVWTDVVFGTLATAIAAVLTYIIGKWCKNRAKPWLGAIPPVLINALVLPLVWRIFSTDLAYLVNFATVLAGQTVAVCVLGVPLYYGLKKTPLVEMEEKD